MAIIINRKKVTFLGALPLAASSLIKGTLRVLHRYCTLTYPHFRAGGGGSNVGHGFCRAKKAVSRIRTCTDWDYTSCALSRTFGRIPCSAAPCLAAFTSSTTL